MGDADSCKSSEVAYLSRFVDYANTLSVKHAKAVNILECGKSAEYPIVADPQNVSDWERLFYRALFENGIRSMVQVPVEKYLLDFAIVDGERRLNIEIDGEAYHRDWNGELLMRDQIRNFRMMELGWDVMRFWVYEVRDDLGGCIARVRRWVEASKVERIAE